MSVGLGFRRLQLIGYKKIRDGVALLIVMIRLALQFDLFLVMHSSGKTLMPLEAETIGPYMLDFLPSTVRKLG